MKRPGHAHAAALERERDQPGAVDRELPGEREPVDSALPRQRGARAQQDQQEHRHQPAQHAVRPEQGGEPRVAQRVEERGHAEGAAKAAGDDARATVELLTERLRLHRLVRDACRLEHGAVPALRHLAGLDEVADRPGVERLVERAPHGVDAARHADDRVHLALPDAQLALVAPEERPALGRGIAGLLQIVQVAAHASDPGIGEVLDQRPDGARLVDGRDVGEHQDVSPSRRDGRVLRQRLPAPPLDPQQADAGRELPHDLVGPVRRAVRRDDHLEAVGGIVARESLFELPPDVPLLVVRTDDERDRRLDCAPVHRPPAHHRHRPQHHGVADVHPGDDGESAEE